MPETHEASDQIDERPSKSQVKREMHALLELGRRLIDLPAARLAQLGLDEKLLDAIHLALEIPSPTVDASDANTSLSEGPIIL